MEPIKHDPVVKTQIKNALQSYLYEPVQRKFKERIDAIIVRNTVLGGNRHQSFHYKGKMYTLEKTHHWTNRNKLIPQLKPEMDQYLEDVKEIQEKELPYVLGYIIKVLNSSNDLQDYLRLLPESVHNPVKALIDSCPCQSKKLTDESVTEIKEKNREFIDMMKRRQVMNLIM